MGIIRSPKYQDLVARGDKVANDKGKKRDESPVKKEQSKEPQVRREARIMAKARSSTH